MGDSGEPKEIVPELLGKLADAFTPGTCGESTGTTTNDKGFKVLDSHVRLIQGDGINTNSVIDILDTVKNAGFSLDNVTFGSGGALLQQMDRDTQKIAFKCCKAIIKGKSVDVYKDPIHDKGKKSKQGSMVLLKDEDLSAEAPWKATAKGANKYAGKCFNLTTVCHYEDGTKRAVWASDDKGKAARQDPESIGRSSELTEEKKKADSEKDLLVPVFRNGRVLKEYKLSDIRKRAASSWEGDPGCSTLQ